MTIVEAFAIALQHHQSGRLAEAEALYRQILAADPGHAPALHLLGVVAHQVGRNDAAEDLIRQAIALVPTAPAFHANLGVALSRLGRPGEAIAAFRTAIQISPDMAEAHNNLGNALRELGEFDGAIAAFRRAIRLRPDNAETHFNLGNALGNQGHLGEAIEVIQRAIQLRPDYAEAHNILGEALKEQGCHGQAAAAFQQAIRFKPDHAEAHSSLGDALRGRGRTDEAIAAYRRAIEIKPDYAEAHNNLGGTLTESGRRDEAIAALRRAIQIRPDYADAHNNLGVALKDKGELVEAIGSFRRALELKPDFADSHSNLLLDLHYLPNFRPEEIFREHCQWEEIHARPLADRIGIHGNDRDPGRRLRVGYVSPDFREHSVAFFVESLLAAHDSAQVEVFCYSDVLQEDRVTERFRKSASQWRKLTGMRDGQVADIIRKDGIDILVDLAGHTAHNRLLAFARKPAPVQVTCLGYCDTTGMKAMDWRMTDAHADPPGTTEHLHAERLLRLPDCAWCFRPPDDSPPVADAPFLRSGHITFGCFNVRPKITEAMVALWAELILQVPGSRLLLKNLDFTEPSAQMRTRELLADAGVARERVEFMGHVPGAREHLACYARVDIALDTFPYHGTTTTCEALWMGVPVVTLAGRTHASRVGVSLLSNAGLPGTIAGDVNEYVRIAADLAADRPRLSELRASQRERMGGSPLMDAPRFARSVESAYRQIWRAWCETTQHSNPS